MTKESGKGGPEHVPVAVFVHFSARKGGGGICPAYYFEALLTSVFTEGAEKLFVFGAVHVFVVAVDCFKGVGATKDYAGVHLCEPHEEVA